MARLDWFGPTGVDAIAEPKIHTIHDVRGVGIDVIDNVVLLAYLDRERA